MTKKILLDRNYSFIKVVKEWELLNIEVELWLGKEIMKGGWFISGGINESRDSLIVIALVLQNTKSRMKLGIKNLVILEEAIKSKNVHMVL